jgi:hypothetical protein
MKTALSATKFVFRDHRSVQLSATYLTYANCEGEREGARLGRKDSLIG